MRTDAQIVHETNDLARLLLAETVGAGYTVPEGHKFWEAKDPRSQKAWSAAVKAMELITKTDAEDALNNFLAEFEDPTKPRRYRSPTGALIIGINEHVHCVASVQGFTNDGTATYAGETKVIWDLQEPLKQDGEIIYVDENGDEWIWSQLKAGEAI